VEAEQVVQKTDASVEEKLSTAHKVQFNALVANLFG